MVLRALAMVGLCCCLMSCAEGGEPPLVAEEILQLNPEANQVVFGLEHFVATGGIRRALVEADTAFFLEGRSLVELRELHVTFYNANGEETSVLTAREGTYDWDNGDMTAKTDVVVVNRAEGRRIETSVLYYHRDEDRIWSDEPTKMIEADGTVIEGTAFESDSRMEQIDLTDPRLTRPGSQPAVER
ncbi:MAG: LPS export ABC transporter periplasmic protein LptC [Gemmatimonadota bacterium]|nr:MAG: LPS export ABC transporter periplasmic protein LptC [Gemmatimonadota bacterium]